MLVWWELIMAVALSQHPSHSEAQTFRLHGFVSDAKTNAVKNAQIELTKANARFTEYSAADGSFSVSLPPGTYSLTVTAKGYCEFSQATSVTSVSQDNTLQVVLLDCSDCPAMSIDFVQPRIEPGVAPPSAVDPQNMVFKYRKETLRDAISSGIRPFVLFGKRSDIGGFIDYTGLDCPGKEKLAVLQYGVGSLEAIKIRLSKRDHKVWAQGDVVVVDRRGVTRGSDVEIDLTQKTPIATFTR